MNARRNPCAVPDDGRPFRVIVPKSNGTNVLFMRYENAGDARQAALLLRWSGSAARAFGPDGAELDLSEGAE